MTYSDVATMVSSIGYPTAYYQFTKQTAQPPPFICFYYVNDADLAADNCNYQKFASLRIELYTETKDFTAEAAVEAVLNTNGLVYERDEVAIDTERLYMVTFYTTVCITED